MSMDDSYAVSQTNSLSQYLGLGYYRLSKEDLRLGESESIENQRSIVREYCQKNNIILIGEFVDDGCSGLNTNRAGFQAALSMIKSGQCNMFITKDLSRLSRDHIEADRFIEEIFPQYGIRYVAVDDNVDTMNEYDIIVPFKNLFNELSSRDTSKKVTNALRVKRERGEYCTRAPYGYIKDGQDNMKLIPDPRCAWVVKRIFEMYADGMKPHDICRTFNEEGIPTPLEVRGWAKPHDSRARKIEPKDPTVKNGWDRSTIYIILHNQVYLGHTVLGKTKRKDFKKKISMRRPKDEWIITKNTHEPLIDQHLFDRCQMSKGKISSDFRNIFSGIAFCDTCGAAMTITKQFSGTKDKPVRGLRCGTNIRFGQRGCESHSIAYDDLLNVVKERLNFYLGMTPEEKKAFVMELEKEMTEGTDAAQIAKSIAQLKMLNSKTDQSISTLIEKSVSGLIAQNTLDSLLKKYTQEIEARNMEIHKLEQQTQQCAKLDFSNFFKSLDEKHPIEEVTREVLEEFIARIEISHYTLPEGRKLRRRGIDGSCGQQIKIWYKFLPAEIQGDSTSF